MLGNGITSIATIENIHNKMCQELPIDHIEVCYRSQKDNRHCRKPKAEMLLNSLKKI